MFYIALTPRYDGRWRRTDDVAMEQPGVSSKLEDEAMGTSQNGQDVAQVVRYRKTEHDYDVQVEARFNANGTAQFCERDGWDLRDYPFPPCPIEMAFAASLRGQPRSNELPHLNLDREVADNAVMKWLTEPASVTKGVAMIDDALRRVSLSRMNGEHLLRQLTDALQRGRQLADKKCAAERKAVRLRGEEALVNTQIEDWLRSVERLVTANGSGIRQVVREPASDHGGADRSIVNVNFA
jgi:hypothetical protein